MKGPVDPALSFTHNMGMSEKRAAPKKTAKKPPSKKHDRLIGYAVLGCGIAAMLGVGALALQRYKPAAPAQPVAIADADASPVVIPAPLSHQKPVERQGVVKEGRAKRVAADKIEGVWESKFLDYYSLFHIQNGTYQIIVMRSVEGKPRYYARGRYAVDGAYLTLTPDKSLGNPQDEDPAHRYLQLTSRAFTIELRVDDNEQSWFAGPVDPKFPRRNPAYPLIQYSGEDGILWTRKAE